MASSTSLETDDQRIVYLITYSRMDATKFPTRKSFSEAVLEAWQNRGIRVLQWVVSLEAHADSDSQSNDINNRYHYHMALKLSKRARWFQVRQFLDEKYGIKVNFSDKHNTYYSAYRYVTKHDTEALHSQRHPDLQDAPKTEKAIATRKRKAKNGDGGNAKKNRKQKGLTVYDWSKRERGKTSLAEFIANRGHKAVDEALELAKEFSEAEARFARSRKTRIQLLEEYKDAECFEGCHGSWITAAQRLLERHQISIKAFCGAVYTALKEGRGKYKNIFVYGPANTGKTFILSPLKKIYRAFCNPATGSFAWLGAEEAEIILLNDFQWNPAIIAWADFLQALEGDTVHLPAPKTFCKQDIELNKDTPIFATSDAPLVLVKGSSIDRANTQMMDVRWRMFHFWRQLPQSEQQNLIPCGHCFAKFILENK
ncbi:hypothetical protein ACROYT_G016051 [Oculina patagonica]